MLKIKLQAEKKTRSPSYNQFRMPWASALPFLDNKLAILIHRPRRACTITMFKNSHMAVEAYCGNHFTGHADKLNFLSEPPIGKLVCLRCETLAVEAGLPTSSELAGRHVHVGKLKAIRTCCNDQ